MYYTKKYVSRHPQVFDVWGATGVPLKQFEIPRRLYGCIVLLSLIEQPINFVIWLDKGIKFKEASQIIEKKTLCHLKYCYDTPKDKKTYLSSFCLPPRFWKTGGVHRMKQQAVNQFEC
jgi:hypothetical protein